MHLRIAWVHATLEILVKMVRRGQRSRNEPKDQRGDQVVAVHMNETDDVGNSTSSAPAPREKL